MLNYDHFYHNCTRNIITVFGALFTEIYVKRSTGDKHEYQEVKVPIAYSPKQRTLNMIMQKPNKDDREAQVTLPRMGFEIVALNYDPDRKINPSSMTKVSVNNSSYVNIMRSATPYNFHINLYIYTKNQDDALQIVEQIFPFFNPDMNVTINPVPSMGVSEDVPIILDSVSYEDDYEGDIDTRRAIVWTLSFTVKMNFYGPITKSGVIKKVNVNMGNDSTTPATHQLDYSAKVNPLTAGKNDVHTIVEEFLYGG